MATYILEKAETEDVLVINKPSSLRDINEKVYTSWFPQCSPPSLLSRSKKAILNFLDQHKKIVIKPTGRMGGQGIFVITSNDLNANVIIEEMTQFETQFVQAQAYIPEIKTIGDKRILIIDGVPVKQGLLRIPSDKDHRGNLAVGAKSDKFELTPQDKYICEQVAPVLKSKGVFFAGIDVIGNYLTEINITSPTGIKEINKMHHINVAKIFFDALSNKINPSDKTTTPLKC